MRNKIGIILLTVIITLLSLYYLSFSFVSRNVENKAKEYATDESGAFDRKKKEAYLDSIWNKPVYNFLGAEFTYKEVKDNALNLGLDLQGGMHVVLEISPADIIVALSGNSTNINFKAALEQAKENLTTSQKDFTTLFFDALEEKDPNVNLAEIFASSANRGIIDYSSSNGEVKKLVQREVNDAIDRAFEIIKTRIDRFGVSQPNVQLIQGTNRIQIELPGEPNPQRVRKLLQGVAKLEFSEVWTAQEFQPFIIKANDYWVKKEKALAKSDTTLIDESSNDELIANKDGEDEQLFESSNGDSISTDSTAVEETITSSPLFSLLKAPGALVYSVEDTAKINTFLNDPKVKSIFPVDLTFMWAFKADQNEEGESFMQLYGIRSGKRFSLEGDVVVDARQSFDQIGNPSVSMSMNVKGSRDWKKMTAKNVGKQIAIVLDGYVYSAPRVSGAIDNGSSSITGNFTMEEAQDLANVLKAGKLPAPTRIVEEVFVGPSLGVQAQNQGLLSVVAGLLLVIVFMIAYYAKGGLVANVALLVNIFFIFGIMAQIKAALTLPGIAGIVLTIGMSIDANVLIFERIKEELRKDDKNLLNAIRLGYNRAFWTIFDSNLTTFLTGIFLFSFGSGPVKGFAVTLMVGIACSFFSAVYVTRVIVTYLTKKGNESKLNFSSPFSKRLLSNSNIDFLSKRKIAYVFSSVLIVIGLALMLTQGLNLGVDFKGGRSYIVEFDKEVVPSKLETALKSNFKDAGMEVKTFGDAKTLKITTNYMVDNESETADQEVLSSLIAGIQTYTGDTYVTSPDPNSGEFTIPSTSKVGATIADDIANAARSAGIYSLIAIFLYIWVRFRRWRFGLGAVVALFHDTLMVLSIFAIARVLGISFEIDQVFVAAVLTIIGYSINDTVVVFDRIREYLGLGDSSDFKGLVNRSINSTLNRTVITSLTTLLVVLILFIFGGEVLRGFSFALLVGILFGTYSSIFVATPIVYDTAPASLKGKTKEEEK